MKKTLTIVLIAAAGALGIAGAAAVFAPSMFAREESRAAQPVWSEINWPFLTDQWGRGKAFACKAADCGTDIKLYLRAKIGFCNCTTGVADDDEVERLADFDLFGNRQTALAPGQPVDVHWMKGRSRPYAFTSPDWRGKSFLTIAFNDKCDAIVATAVVDRAQPAALESAILAFLNTERVLRWAQATLGL